MHRILLLRTLYSETNRNLQSSRRYSLTKTEKLWYQFEKIYILLNQYVDVTNFKYGIIPASYACQSDQERQLLIPVGQKQS